MVVEPESLGWLTGRIGAARDGITGAAEFARLPALKALVREDGTGLGKGWRRERDRRRAGGRADLDDTPDVSHTRREGARALGRSWGGAARALGRAAVARGQLDRRGRQGQSRTGYATPARRVGRRAEHAWDQAEMAEAAGARLKAAFASFTREGRLNDRHQAQAVVVAALPHLKGQAWAKARRLWRRGESFTALDQASRRRSALGLAQAPLSAWLDREGWRRQPWRSAGSTAAALAPRGWALVRTIPLGETRPDWPGPAQRVREVLRGVWRARSSVGCLNSVARLQPTRPRKLTQGLLDLKRLSWDLRRFRTGRRQGRTPSGLLGVKLPELSIRELLELTPDQLRQQLSAADDVA